MLTNYGFPILDLIASVETGLQYLSDEDKNKMHCKVNNILYKAPKQFGE